MTVHPHTHTHMMHVGGVSEAAPIGAPVIGAALITVHGLSLTYGNGGYALQDVNFTLYEGERLAVIGPNGAGKSTLIQTIMGLLQAQQGTVTITGGRDRLGYVPQHQEVNWDFPVTVRDAVMMGRARHIGWMRWPRRKDWAAVDVALERVGIATLGKRQVGELSGGQRRRVFIARALVQDTDTLILDEPFSGVDVGAQAGLMDVLEALNAEGITIVLSTHDLNLAFQRFTSVMALNGRLIAYGSPEAVYTPDVLRALYGGRVAIVDDMLFVDDPGCDGC